MPTPLKSLYRISCPRKNVSIASRSEANGSSWSTAGGVHLLDRKRTTHDYVKVPRYRPPVSKALMPHSGSATDVLLLSSLHSGIVSFGT